jgi:hypothetical protein
MKIAKKSLRQKDKKTERQKDERKTDTGKDRQEKDWLKFSKFSLVQAFIIFIVDFFT